MLRPFIPAKDFAVSRRFYEALGFETEYADDTVAVLSNADASFLVQNFYTRELAENFMVQLSIADLDAWWETHDPAALAESFGPKPPTQPAVQPWGLKVGFVHDPSGVLWHVAQATE